MGTKPRSGRPEKLTPKQEAFIREYLVDLNATQAARRAGYKGSDETLRAVGCENLTKPNIAAAVAEAQAKRAAKLEITADDLAREMAKLALANAGDFFDWGPGGIVVKEKSSLTRDQHAAVAEVSETITQGGGSVRVKMHDKRAAIMDLAELLGFRKQKHEHSGPDGQPIPFLAHVRELLLADGAGEGQALDGNPGRAGRVAQQGEAQAPAPPSPPRRDPR